MAQPDAMATDATVAGRKQNASRPRHPTVFVVSESEPNSGSSLKFSRDRSNEAATPRSISLPSLMRSTSCPLLPLSLYNT